MQKVWKNGIYGKPFLGFAKDYNKKKTAPPAFQISFLSSGLFGRIEKSLYKCHSAPPVSYFPHLTFLVINFHPWVGRLGFLESYRGLEYEKLSFNIKASIFLHSLVPQIPLFFVLNLTKKKNEISRKINSGF